MNTTGTTGTHHRNGCVTGFTQIGLQLVALSMPPPPLPKRGIRPTSTVEGVPRCLPPCGQTSPPPPEKSATGAQAKVHSETCCCGPLLFPSGSLQSGPSLDVGEAPTAQHPEQRAAVSHHLVGDTSLLRSRPLVCKRGSEVTGAGYSVP